MRRVILAGLFCAAATLATAAPKPAPAPGPAPAPVGCTDLGIVNTAVLTHTADGPVPANGLAVAFKVRNFGTGTYAAPDENKQWLTLEFETAAGARQVGVHVLPPTGSGPFTLARGREWGGVITGTIPADIVRPTPPLRLKLNYAPAGPGWVGPSIDCNVANNALPVR